MSAPWLTYCIPTIGRPTLAATLASIRVQATPAEIEIVCVGDTYGDGLATALGSVPALCRQYGARYVEHNAGFHAYGHPQRTYGQQQARGQWIAFLQDDDALCVGAIAAIDQAVSSGGQRHPWLFRIDGWQAGVVWRTPELWLGNIDADCVVVPNEPDRLVAWGTAYTDDHAYIRATVAAWGEQVGWADAIIARGRPHVPRAFASPPVAL